MQRRPSVNAEVVLFVVNEGAQPLNESHKPSTAQ